ncbi:MAG TPA: ROK family protein [Actinomycetota bacterium]|nr:ROK family protein [Actinomycetota bacterium]
MDSAETPTNSATASAGPEGMVAGAGPLRRRGLAAEELRRHNLGAVLERLHLAGPLTRSELTAATGLNRSTVADLLGELGGLGLVEERPSPAPSGPGRPSPVVHAKPEGAIVLAVEIAVDSVAVATVGLGGHVYNRIRIARPRGRFSPNETVQDVAKLAGPLLDALPATHSFVGVGAAVAGITRRSDGFVHLAPNLGWRDVPLAAMLAAGLDLGVPVLAANEADLGALAEHRRGDRPGVDNLVYVSGEVGIGAGIVVDGKVLLGAAGYAGEVGHMLINPGGLPCGCGATGCWETEAGETALLRRVGLGAGSDHLDRMAERAADGDEATLRAITEVGGWLGLGIGNLVNLFNPEMVVVGGLFHRLFRFLEPSMLEAVASRALAPSRPQAIIAPSALGPDAHLIGAAELVMSTLIADPAGADGRREGAG